MELALPDPLPPNYFTENRGYVLLTTASTFLALVIITFILRMVSRQIQKVHFGWDDALVIVALLGNIVNCIFTILAVPLSGVGQHTPVVLGPNMEHFEKLSFMGLNALLITPITYSFSIATSKFAILQLYLKIFRHGYIRWICYAVGFVVAAHALAVIFVSIFQCKHISTIWKDPSRTNCIDSQTFFGYASVPNSITDVVMLITPLPEIWRLNTSNQMKLGVTITFIAGSVGVIVSILRTIAHFKTTAVFYDPLWESLDLMVYDVSEPSTYFICACFLTLRPLLRWTKAKLSTISRSLYSRERLGSDSDLVERGTEEIPKPSSKKARAFDSILLSKISGQKSTVEQDG